MEEEDRSRLEDIESLSQQLSSIDRKLDRLAEMEDVLGVIAVTLESVDNTLDQILEAVSQR
ncbi:MAG: hypothetical protein ACOC6A_02980 [Chloroflexota bacterium]|jgi:hypothetical protein